MDWPILKIHGKKRDNIYLITIISHYQRLLAIISD